MAWNSHVHELLRANRVNELSELPPAKERGVWLDWAGPAWTGMTKPNLWQAQRAVRLRQSKRSGCARGMLPQPSPIRVQARSRYAISATWTSLRVSIWGVKKTPKRHSGNILPLLIFRMAVHEGEAIAPAIIFSWHIRIARASAWSQIAFHIPIVKCIHRFVGKNPRISRPKAGYVARFGEELPTTAHGVQVIHNALRYHRT